MDFLKIFIQVDFSRSTTDFDMVLVFGGWHSLEYIPCNYLTEQSINWISIGELTNINLKLCDWCVIPIADRMSAQNKKAYQVVDFIRFATVSSTPLSHMVHLLTLILYVVHYCSIYMDESLRSHNSPDLIAFMTIKTKCKMRLHLWTLILNMHGRI